MYDESHALGVSKPVRPSVRARVDDHDHDFAADDDNRIVYVYVYDHDVIHDDHHARDDHHDDTGNRWTNVRDG